MFALCELYAMSDISEMLKNVSNEFKYFVNSNQICLLTRRLLNWFTNELLPAFGVPMIATFINLFSLTGFAVFFDVTEAVVVEPNRIPVLVASFGLSATLLQSRILFLLNDINLFGSLNGNPLTATQNIDFCIFADSVFFIKKKTKNI